MKFGLALFHLLMRLMPRWYSAEQRADATALTATLARDARQRRGAVAALGVTLALGRRILGDSLNSSNPR